MGCYRYQCYGLKISSEFCCPELLEDTFEEQEGVVIKYGLVPDDLPHASRKAARYSISAGQLLLEVDNVAKFWVKDGKEVIVELNQSGSEDDMRVFLYGTVFGTLILQAGRVPLHATTVVKNGRALAIAGPSGAGKSTLAHTLIGRGWQLLSDDVTVIEPRGDQLYVQPGYPSVKLWRDVLEASNTDCSHLKVIRMQVEKYRWNTPLAFHSRPSSLIGIVGLFAYNQPKIDIEKIEGVKKFVFLAKQTYRRQMIAGMAEIEKVFGVWSKSIQGPPFWCIRRPSVPLNPYPLADAVESLLT